MNNSEKTYLQKLFLLSFLEPESFNDISHNHTDQELNDCDEEIRNCNDMLQYYISTGDEEDIKNWKQLLQQAKTRKRMLRKMIKGNITERELVS